MVTNLAVGADSNRKPTFRNPINVFESNEEDAVKFRREVKKADHICAILAPLWADAEMGSESKV